ncbi:MAG: HIT family protein [Actinomycetota bacterium]
MTEQPFEAAEVFAGHPDSFERLWTPHRMVYLRGENKPLDSSVTQCPFCVAPQRDDHAGLIVHRGVSAYVVLNLYPYNPGHLLICPYRHVADYAELVDAELVELARLSQQAVAVITASAGASGPRGFNLGMNLGAVAGAGIAAHVHQHVVPRWAGDGNFLPIIAQTKALPETLNQTRERLAQAWLTVAQEAPPCSSFDA